MISLRTHAISLAAVFLALAVGVALGSGLLSHTLLSGLRDDKHELQNQINTLTDDKNALNEKLNAAGEFDAQMSPRILHNALAGKSVVVFRTPDANDDDVDALTRMAGQAGGTVTGTVGLTQEFVDAKDPKVQAVDDAQRDTGFVTYGTQRIGAANTALVITGGGLSDSAGNQGATVARFAAGLAPHGSGVVVAGRDGSASGTAAVAVTRSDAGLSNVVSTVDDADTESGRLTAVLALSDLINGGRPGQYGVGQGASSVTLPQ
ncbi:MAG: copper transporter [Mycobacterium sp.]|nr:copper transporter [Mycobacterium sp.]